MTEHLIQGSPEWIQARVGVVTASRLSDILAKPREKGATESASWRNYRAQIVAERLTGQSCEDSFKSRATERGSEMEGRARNVYEVTLDVLIDQVGLVPHPHLALCGASPDGLIGDDGQLEIKCPNTATHIDTLFADKIPTEYRAQMQWGMACTGRAWCDFVSFDDRLPEDIAFFRKRVPRDDEYIAAAEAAVTLFLAQVEEYVEKLKRIGGGR